MRATENTATRFDGWLFLFVSIVVAVILGTIAHRLGDEFERWWLFVGPLPLVLIVYHYRQSLSRRQRSIFYGVLVGLILFNVWVFIAAMLAYVVTPPMYDYKAFYHFARVASMGQNFYEVEHALALLAPTNPPPYYLAEFYFPYPPQAMLLFGPFGLIDNLSGSLLAWYGFTALVLIISIYILWQQFLKADGLPGLALVVLFVLTMQTTKINISFGQRNLFVLFMAILFWRDATRPRAGIWLMMATLVNPWVAVLGLYVILTKRWRIILAALATFLALTIVTLLAYGPDATLTYFTNNPIPGTKDHVFSMNMNQSLLAEFLRITHTDIQGLLDPQAYPIYLLALLLVGVTGWMIWKLNRKAQVEWMLALCIPLGLMIYPHTLIYYVVLLILPVLLLWRERAQFPASPWLPIGLITLLYALTGYQNGETSLYGDLLCWLAVMALCIWKFRLIPLPTALRQPAV